MAADDSRYRPEAMSDMQFRMTRCSVVDRLYKHCRSVATAKAVNHMECSADEAVIYSTKCLSVISSCNMYSFTTLYSTVTS